MHRMHYEKRYGEFETIRLLLSTLLTLRNELVSVNAAANKDTLRTEVLHMIDRGRRLMGMDVVVRNVQTGAKLNHLNTGSIRLYQLVRIFVISHLRF